MSPSNAAVDASIKAWWIGVAVAPLILPSAMSILYERVGRAGVWTVVIGAAVVSSVYEVWWWWWSYDDESTKSPWAYIVWALLLIGIPSVVAGSIITGPFGTWLNTRLRKPAGTVAAIAAAYLTLALGFFPFGFVFLQLYIMTGGFI